MHNYVQVEFSKVLLRPPVNIFLLIPLMLHNSYVIAHVKISIIHTVFWCGLLRTFLYIKCTFIKYICYSMFRILVHLLHSKGVGLYCRRSWGFEMLHYLLGIECFLEHGMSCHQPLWVFILFVILHRCHTAQQMIPLREISHVAYLL